MQGGTRRKGDPTGRGVPTFEVKEQTTIISFLGRGGPSGSRQRDAAFVKDLSGSLLFEAIDTDLKPEPFINLAVLKTAEFSFDAR